MVLPQLLRLHPIDANGEDKEMVITLVNDWNGLNLALPTSAPYFGANDFFGALIGTSSLDNDRYATVNSCPRFCNVVRSADCDDCLRIYF